MMDTTHIVKGESMGVAERNVKIVSEHFIVEIDKLKDMATFTRNPSTELPHLKFHLHSSAEVSDLGDLLDKVWQEMD